jgi:hypothetical protein
MFWWSWIMILLVYTDSCCRWNRKLRYIAKVSTAYYLQVTVNFLAQSVWRLATGWRVRDRIPLDPRFSAPVHTGPGAHPASYTMGTWSISRGVKRPGRGVDHPPTSRAEVKERVKLHLYSHSGPSWRVLRCTMSCSFNSELLYRHLFLKKDLFIALRCTNVYMNFNKSVPDTNQFTWDVWLNSGNWSSYHWNYINDQSSEKIIIKRRRKKLQHPCRRHLQEYVFDAFMPVFCVLTMEIF